MPRGSVIRPVTTEHPKERQHQPRDDGDLGEVALNPVERGECLGEQDRCEKEWDSETDAVETARPASPAQPYRNSPPAEARMARNGPIHGVQPNANAAPITGGPRSPSFDAPLDSMRRSFITGSRKRGRPYGRDGDEYSPIAMINHPANRG